MAILIEGMEMPKTGLYFVGVDNTNGRDKTVITVERMLGNRDVRQIVGSFELITVPEPHGRLIDADAVIDLVMQYCPDDDGVCSKAGADLRELLDEIENLPPIIPASGGKEDE